MAATTKRTRKKLKKKHVSISSLYSKPIVTPKIALRVGLPVKESKTEQICIENPKIVEIREPEIPEKKKKAPCDASSRDRFNIANIRDELCPVMHCKETGWLGPY